MEIGTNSSLKKLNTVTVFINIMSTDCNYCKWFGEQIIANGDSPGNTFNMIDVPFSKPFSPNLAHWKVVWSNARYTYGMVRAV